MAGPTSAAVTEQIRQASDIVDVVSAYVSLKRAGRQFKALCPFHRERTPSFHLDPQKQFFKCFGCGVGGDVFKFVQLRENVGFPEAKGILAERAGIALQTDRYVAGGDAGPSKSDLQRVNQWAARWFQEQLRGANGERARNYVASRGISEASAEAFGLGYAPESWEALSKAADARKIPSQLLLAAGLTRRHAERGTTYDAFRNRLMFPIRDPLDRTIGFGGRTLGDDPAKYVNSSQSPLFDKSRCLYGLNSAKNVLGKESPAAVVVEGYTDCIMAHQHGFPQVVATLGTALTVEHVFLLRRYVGAVTIVFDSDEAGRRAADQALKLFLESQVDVRVAHVPKGKDPAALLQEAGSDAFGQVLTSAVEALEFKWKQVRRQYQDVATGPERRRAIEEFLGLLVRAADLGDYEPIQRGLILNQVAKLLGLPSEEVHRQLRIITRRSRTAPRAGERRSPTGPVARAGDAVSAAMRVLLEVLLNEPTYYAAIAKEFKPELISDERIRDIARIVAEMASEKSDFTVSELLGRIESVETSNCIIALRAAGEERGNYGATIEGAIQRLQQLREQGRIGELQAALRRGRTAEKVDAGDADEDASDSSSDDVATVSAMKERARQMGHFAGRRHLGRRSTEPHEPQPAAPAGQ